MRTLLIFLAFSTFTFAQTSKTKDFIGKDFPCSFELNLAQLTSEKLSFKCTEAFNGNSFSIKNFKVKFRKNPTIKINGTSLNSKATSIAKNSEIGDYIVFYDIETVTLENTISNKYNTLMVKLVE